MKISFEKYHGSGNDFIIINNLSKTLPNLNKEIIKQLCDRKFGIGADGLIIVVESSEYHFKMNYYKKITTSPRSVQGKNFLLHNSEFVINWYVYCSSNRQTFFLHL